MPQRWGPTPAAAQGLAGQLGKTSVMIEGYPQWLWTPPNFNGFAHVFQWIIICCSMDFHNFPDINGLWSNCSIFRPMETCEWDSCLAAWFKLRYTKKNRWLTGLMMSAQDTYSGPQSINRSAYVSFKTHPVVDVATTYCYPSCKQIYLS